MSTMTFGKIANYGAGNGSILILRDGVRVGHIYKTRGYHQKGNGAVKSYQVHWSDRRGPSAVFEVAEYGNTNAARLAAKDFALSAHKRRKWS